MNANGENLSFIKMDTNDENLSTPALVLRFGSRSQE